MELKINVSEIIEVPAGTTIHVAPTGVTPGFELPDGRVIKVWISYEIEEGNSCRDLTYDELSALGITQGLDVERHVEEV